MWIYVFCESFAHSEGKTLRHDSCALAKIFNLKRKLSSAFQMSLPAYFLTMIHRQTCICYTVQWNKLIGNVSDFHLLKWIVFAFSDLSLSALYGYKLIDSFHLGCIWITVSLLKCSPPLRFWLIHKFADLYLPDHVALHYACPRSRPICIVTESGGTIKKLEHARKETGILYRLITNDCNFRNGLICTLQ